MNWLTRQAQRTARVSAVAFALSNASAGVASAQDWPSAGVVAAAGVSTIDSRAAFGLTADLSRSWGPVVGSLLGDLAIFAYRTDPRTVVDAVNGQVYCGSRRVNDVNTSCRATVDGVGGVLAELGFSLAPYVPLVISRGYRLSPVSESYFAATVHGATSKGPVRWLLRGAAGKRTVQVHAGVVIDLDFVVR